MSEEIAGHQAPFVVYYRFAIPGQARLASRSERRRYAAKISRLLYATLAANGSLNVAQPGGGASSDAKLYTFTDMVSGMQYVPQFGDAPAQLRLPGFVVLATPSTQLYANSSVVLDNRFLPGPMTGQFPAAVKVVQATILAEVKSLKAILDAAATTTMATYADAALQVFRLNYKGQTWGDHGFHFPR